MARSNSESGLQQRCVQILSAYSVANGFMFFAPMNEGVMMVMKMFKIPDNTCFRIIQWMKKMGFLPGVADLQVIKAGKCYFIELKTENGKMKESQELFASNAAKCGCEYAVVRNVIGLKEALSMWSICEVQIG